MGTKAVDLLEKLANTGYSGISYVGAANYQSRENEAKRNLGDTHDKLYVKAKEIDEKMLKSNKLLRNLYNSIDSCVELTPELLIEIKTHLENV